MKREIRFREIRAGYIFLYIFLGGGGYLVGEGKK